jgi:hypothetical protein
MKSSPYLSNLLKDYRTEIHDLRFDSEGNDILNARLADKKSEFRGLLPMMAFEPLMVAATFHGGIKFGNSAAMESVVLCSPGGFPIWSGVAEHLTIDLSLESLVDLALAEKGGDEFMTIAACLQFLDAEPDQSSERSEHQDPDPSQDSGDGDGDDEYTTSQANGEDWLSSQGFDKREPT